ncbi:Protein of avirulence locus ImpE [hydrothermal vent metagenome]|uniref:Protein of avirulence locus ImpE n=1 Tax=hydrothermal vent metagenome TaxID=652676 RepID=A0A3B0Y1E5_9ZZZZ
MDAQKSLSGGDFQETLFQLQAEIRRDPSNVKNRVFLFQLLAVLGQWDRALTQLSVIGEMDDSALAMVQMYREAILCEGMRVEVFAGKRSPVVFGKPEQWLALLLEALRLSAEGEYAQSQDIRDQAFDMAPLTSGVIVDPDEQKFNWIADADPRMGPVLEAIINGLYYWVPFHRIRTIKIEAPQDMRDMVWMPAYFTWANGGETVGLIPVRYPGSETSDDQQILSAHKTIWQEFDNGLYQGMGQRMLATDVGEYSLMDLRRIDLDTQDEDAQTAPPAETDSIPQDGVNN